MAVLVGVSQANHRSVGEFDAARSLDLEKECLDRIGDIDERLAEQGRRAAFDVCARPVGHYFFAFHATTHTLVLEFRIQVGQVDGQQVVRRRVQRHGELRLALPRTLEQRLVVAGDASDVVAVGGRDAVWDKMRLEESANAFRAGGIYVLRIGAWLLPKWLRFRVV